MPQFVQTLKNEDGRITGLVTDDEKHIRADELTTLIESDERCYVDFGEEKEFEVTMIAREEGFEPGIFDPDGEYTMDDLPSTLDPMEAELDAMNDRMERDGEFEPDAVRRVPDEKRDPDELT